MALTAPDPRGSEERAQKSPAAITLRAVGIGLVMVVLIVWMTQVLSITYDASDVGGNAPPPTPTYLLFFYALFAAPLLLRGNRRLALSRAELLLIYAMMIIAGPITHLYAMAYLLPHTVSPYYFAAHEPGWREFLPLLPSWLGPRDRSAVVGFFRGTGGVVPWQTWLPTLIAWSSLLIALFFVMLCINVLMKKQWVDYERLVFPLTAIPLALSEEDRAGYFRQPTRLLRVPLFWLGFALPLLIQAPTALNRYIPVIPALPLKEVVIVNGKQLSLPWNGLDQIEFDLIFWLVGIVYLLPTELAFSAWFFYAIRLMENVAAVWGGVSGEAPSVYTNEFPALFAQGAGAAFALTGITLWAAQRHLLAAARKAFGKRSAADDSGEFLSYRTAFFGALLGIAFILFWCVSAGMRLWVAALLFAFILAYFFIFARIRAETGLGMGVILWPKMLDEVMVTVVGAKYLTLPDLTVLASLRWLYFGSAIGSVMACQLEGIKLADVGGLRGRRVGGIFALAATLTVPLAFAWTLKTYYSHGFETMLVGRRETSMVGSQIYWAYQDMMETHGSLTGPDWKGILAMGGGALVTVALSALRMRFLWFPLHPVGYLAANSWGMHINWASFLIGWLLKLLITRYGGLSLYTRLLPLFLGLIVGDMVHEGIWGFVAWMVRHAV